MAATTGPVSSTNDVNQLQLLVEKLQHEKSSSETLANNLMDEMRELSKELASLKKENLMLKANAETSNTSTQVKQQQFPHSNSHQQSSITAEDAKLSETDNTSYKENNEYQKLQDYQLYYHTPSGYYYESVTQQYLYPCSYNNQDNNTTLKQPPVTDVPDTDNSNESQQIQSDDTEVQSKSQTDSNFEPQSQSKSDPDSHPDSTVANTNDPSTSSKSDSHSDSTRKSSADIASQLAAVSDNAMQQYGFTYDESSGYYYDQRTGLYYDQANQLYYNSQLGTYYTYNTEAGQYEPYYALETDNSITATAAAAMTTEDTTPHIEERETMSLKSRVVNESKMYLEIIQELEAESPEEEGGVINGPPPVNEWPPCVRVVPRSDVYEQTLDETDARRNINVITAEGVEIGRDVSGPQTLRIKDIQVSKRHCEIRYLRRRESFAVTDLGSQNGTYLNGERISEVKETSKPHLLFHRDVLTIGSTPFLLHIHHGLASCPDCAQIGSFRAPSDATIISSEPVYNEESLDLQRRKELNKIKKKYGLRAKDTYNDKLYQLPDQYTDKSAERRVKFGSDLPESAIRDDLPSSTTRAIADDNRGKQMLMKFGWQDGQGLGRDNTGRQEPVTAVIRQDRCGLGFGPTPQGMDQLSTGNNHQKTESRNKMVKHFQQVVDREAKRKKT